MPIPPGTPVQHRMQVEHGRGQAGFLAALSELRRTVDGLDDAALLATSWCRGWTVGDVLVHTHLGLQELLLGVVSPSDAVPDTDAASYWRPQAADQPSSGFDVDHTRFVRLLAAAYRRPRGVLDHLRLTAGPLAGAVDRLAPGAVAFQGRVLSTGDFLATWAVELAVHHLDLARELALDPPPAVALDLARETLEALAGAPLPRRADQARLILIGTGRVPPTPDEAAALGDLAASLPVL